MHYARNFQQFFFHASRNIPDNMQAAFAAVGLFPAHSVGPQWAIFGWTLAHLGTVPTAAVQTFCTDRLASGQALFHGQSSLMMLRPNTDASFSAVSRLQLLPVLTLVIVARETPDSSANRLHVMSFRARAVANVTRSMRIVSPPHSNACVYKATTII